MLDDQVVRDMKITLENIKKIFTSQDDVKYKVTYIRGEPELRVDLIYIDGMVNIESINADIIRALNENPVFKKVVTIEDA